ncbi:MAG: substrate-binding domain-containing protein [Candidatus Eisenbacteria bacterium]
MADSEATERRKSPLGRLLRLRIRILVYAVIIFALLLIRLVPGVRQHLPHPGKWQLEAKGFILTGADLAPALTEKLLADYRERYPEVEVTVRSGGTAQGLEALINKQADVALLNRRPMPDEQSLFRRTLGDTVESWPIALGGIVLLARAERPIEALTVEQLRDFLRGGDAAARGPIRRLYAPDPNLGLWDAVTQLLQVSAPPGGKWPGVIFLADPDSALVAVERDPEAFALASTLSLPSDLSARSLRVVPVRGALSGAGTRPEEEEIATGDYPLFHHLYVSCRPDGGIQGSMFVTYLYSGRGQRLVRRLGFLPAREVAREVVLTTNPIGRTK